MNSRTFMAVAAAAWTLGGKHPIENQIKQPKRPLKPCLNNNCYHKTDHKSGFCSAQCNKERNQWHQNK